jgi:hypothetical protein
MFNFKEWITTFQNHYSEHGEAYNDSVSLGAQIKPATINDIVIDNTFKVWKAIGIHHLSPYENKGGHNVYVEVLCKQNEREGFKAIHWTWEGRQPHEPAPDVFAGQKPHNELVDIPLNLGMVVSVWPHLGERVTGLSSNHPDEPIPSGEKWNTIGHHSFFICFQEIEDGAAPPSPDPEPEPANAIIRVSANIDWLNTLPVDNQGNVNFEVT